MAGMDLTWLNFSADPIYHKALGAVLAEQANAPAAAAFYLLYVAGILYFGALPSLRSGDWHMAIWNGALFGFFAYMTYDLTNLATLKIWSLKVSLIDMAWGTFVTCVSATAAAYTGLLLRR